MGRRSRDGVWALFLAGVGRLVVHNSPIRGETFVTRKITRALARIKLGLQDRLYLGNLSARRDWGHARDYVRMQWLMLQQDAPEDYVIATGRQHSVREFVEEAAKEIGIQIRWEGKGVDEKGYWTEPATLLQSRTSPPVNAAPTAPQPTEKPRLSVQPSQTLACNLLCRTERQRRTQTLP